jgi:hypothetical protein
LSLPGSTLGPRFGALLLAASLLLTLAAEISRVKEVTLPAGPAVLLVYTLNSDPNPITGKQYRLENTSFLLFDNSRLATLTLSAPLGADNVDDWRLISRSFRWQ